MAGIGEKSNRLSRIQKSNKTATQIRTYITERRVYFISKRIFDLLISFLVIVFILSWLYPLLAILIKLDSKGPILFIQRRVGFLGKSFRCFKFRTMVINDLSDKQQAMANDPRITRLGRFLRITSLDELPQFFNVLRGEMSIVGPRPHMHKDNDDFGRQIENYRLRCFLKPGITGMAQVKGLRGPAQEFFKVFHRYQWDTFYIRNANLSLDFKIIRLTAFQLLKSIISYKREPGIEEEKSIPAEAHGAVNFVEVPLKNVQ
jgi:putative colanic acid biosysnthesis UDP-glucose lipid carrier transferase